MENQTMGRVVVHVKVVNFGDLFNVKQGLLAPEKVRSIEIDDALVDTGASMFSLPKRHIEQLGLMLDRTRTARTSAGIMLFKIYGPVRLTVQGRDCHVEVAEVPDDCPALIGQLPLEMLDFLVDPIGQRLVGNPAHNGEHMIEMY